MPRTAISATNATSRYRVLAILRPKFSPDKGLEIMSQFVRLLFTFNSPEAVLLGAIRDANRQIKHTIIIAPIQSEVLMDCDVIVSVRHCSDIIVTVV